MFVGHPVVWNHHLRIQASDKPVCVDWKCNVYVKMHNGLKERKQLFSIINKTKFDPSSFPGTTEPTVESICADNNVHNIYTLYNDPKLYSSIDWLFWNVHLYAAVWLVNPSFEPLRQCGPRQWSFYANCSMVSLRYSVLKLGLAVSILPLLLLFVLLWSLEKCKVLRI